MRRPLVAGNWKMNTSLAEAVELARRVAAAPPDGVEVVVCPPFPWLVPVANVISGTPVALGGQNCWTEPSGAYTGEVSAAMLAEMCRYVIVGHSERRKWAGESDELVAAKLRAVLANGLAPILCIGEDLGEREAGQAEAHVTGQLEAALTGLSPDLLGTCVVAYEPIWAIGTGLAAEPADAAGMAAVIRDRLRSLSPAAADAVRILYGGSVNDVNAAALLAGPDVDGALVGGASLKADGFLAIARASLPS